MEQGFVKITKQEQKHLAGICERYLQPARNFLKELEVLEEEYFRPVEGVFLGFWKYTHTPARTMFPVYLSEEIRTKRVINLIVKYKDVLRSSNEVYMPTPEYDRLIGIKSEFKNLTAFKKKKKKGAK